ncbi:hypothetical protein [Saccharothrix australiensis]|uniref:GLTT repeat-containing protein n=1 Tax=Saccharothrix australiensis TaxID=2072 RepID=A0A495W1G0_9PSEU|nr:hypothetical protein [Saccharothrix australiensis]RKT55299.1 hypothetical protein C8E97_3961 [Saccharothrix australiensis]
MKRLLTLGLAVVLLGLTATGVANAETTPIWVLPGVDLGSLLGPTTGVPGGLAPVFDLLKLIGA